jgi:hypothetical protein
MSVPQRDFVGNKILRKCEKCLILLARSKADQEWARKQKLLDHLWQQKLDSEAPLDDGYVEIGGFRERRTRYGFTKHWRDLDFDTH